MTSRRPPPASALEGTLMTVTKEQAAVAAVAAVRLRGPAIARLGHVHADEQDPAPAGAAATTEAAS
jgi:hypothetical protein